MGIETALQNYLVGKGPRVKEKDFIDALDKIDSNAIINAIFKLINKEIDSMTDSKCLDRVVEVLKYIEIIILDYSGVNEKLLKRRINRLDEKLDRILIEDKRKFMNMRKINSEFNKVKRQLERLDELLVKRDTTKYEFMKFLISVERNVGYIEFALQSTPSLVNVRDKQNTPLFKNILKKFLEKVEKLDEDGYIYYGNLLSLIASQRKFRLTEYDRKRCLEEVNAMINKLTYRKKTPKSNFKKLELLRSVVELLRKRENRETNINAIASKYNIQLSFDSEVLEQARLAGSLEGRMTGRETISDYTISIDGDYASGIDDALSCYKLENGNIILKVHSSSVLGYYPYDSKIIQSALSRCQTLYLPKKYMDYNERLSKLITIFPYEFIREAASLCQDKSRLARTYIFEIDPNGNIVGERFIKSIVKVDKKASHDEINDIIENGTSNPKMQEIVSNLVEATRRLEKKYKPSELYEKVKENTGNAAKQKPGRMCSEKIVNYAMTLTGNRVAEFFYRNNYPCLYRVHYIDPVNSQKLQTMIESLTASYGGEQFESLYQLIDGVYPKGAYALTGGHSGLNLEHYCTCTSESRRSADIIIEHALEVCYDRKPTLQELEELQEEIERRVQELNTKQSQIGWFMKEYGKRRRS